MTTLGLIAVAVTLCSFIAARAVVRRIGAPPWASPVLLGALVVGLLAWAAGVTPAAYSEGTAPLSWWLRPAVVALGALLWDARAELRRRAVPLLVAVGGGVIVGVASAVAIARAAGLATEVAAAFTTRTISTPFAVAIHEHLGRPVALAAAFAVLGGVVGTVVVPPLLRAARIGDDGAIGTAVGLSSHLVGTDWLVRRHPAAAPFSGAAMVLAGILAALVVPPLWPWLATLLP